MGFPAGVSGEEPACQCRRHRRHQFHPWVGRIHWRRAWQPTPVSLPGGSRGHTSLVGYGPHGPKESDRLKRLGSQHPVCHILEHIPCRQGRTILQQVAAAAAKSLQSCPTLCDPIDGSPPGSPVPGFSRQEHWSGLPFPSPMHESESERKVAQSCSTLSDPVDCSPAGPSVHGISQARILKWVAITSSRGSSWPWA